jgi:hypothetical protein
MLPMCAPASMIAAWGLRDWLDVPDALRTIRSTPGHAARRLPHGLGTTAVILTVAWGAGLLFLLVPSLTRRVGFSDAMSRLLLWNLLVAVAIPLLAWRGYGLFREPRRRPSSLIALGLAGALGWTVGLLAEGSMARPYGNPALVERMRTQGLLSEPVTVTTVGYVDQSLSYYLRRFVPRIERDRPDFQPPAEAGWWVIIADQDGWEQVTARSPDFAARFECVINWPRPRHPLRVLVPRGAAPDTDIPKVQ